MSRRRTDQVYATLQQVQRRITEAAGGDLGEDVAAKPPTATPTIDSPLARDHAPSPLHPLGRLGEGPRSSSVVGAPKAPGLLMPLGQPSTTANPSTPTPPASPSSGPGRAPLLTLTSELATFLVVLWLATLAIAFFVGRSQAPRVPIDPGADYAAGPAGHRDPDAARAAAAKHAAPAPANGGDVLVLISSQKSSAAEEARLDGMAKDFNDKARASGGQFKPWFAVRKPASGGLQLVWGCVDGKYGVDSAQYEAFSGFMVKNGYASAYWQPVGDGR